MKRRGKKVKLRVTRLPKDYPVVRCDKPVRPHPPEPGYAVCGRVAKDCAEVHEVVKATKKRVGQILCDGKHHPHDHTTLKDVVTCCAGCARERGWIE